jgi:hypothetical protein
MKGLVEALREAAKSILPELQEAGSVVLPGGLQPNVVVLRALLKLSPKKAAWPLNSTRATPHAKCKVKVGSGIYRKLAGAQPRHAPSCRPGCGRSAPHSPGRRQQGLLGLS